MPIAHLSPIDLAIVAFYLVAITLFGLSFSRKAKGSAKGSEKSLKSYFLADNTIPWWAIALSIVSAETSTLTIISIPGVAFAGDLGFLQVVLGYMVGRIVVALLFLPRYFRGEMLTAYQLIDARFSSDQRFGHTLHKVTAGLFLLTRAAAEGVRVFAISIVVGIAIGTGDILSIGLISALTLLYTFEGGMAAVIWTDVVQMGLYVAGTLVALWSLGHHVPGGWTYIHAVAAPLGKFHWLDFSFTLTRSYTFWAGLLGGTFLTMASHGTDQLMVQRMLAARNLRESRLALLSSGVVIFLQFTLFLLIGVGLFVFYGLHPQAFGAGGIGKTSPDRIFPTFIVQQMPHGVAGLLVAAILAAAMSNLSAALNSLASTSVIDFYLPFLTRRDTNKNLSSFAAGGGPASPTPAANPNTTLPSRLFTVFWAVILFAIAVYSIRAGGKGHVVETGLSIASVAYGCLLGVFLLGTLTRYATQTGAILGMICGFTLNVILWQFPGHVLWRDVWKQNGKAFAGPVPDIVIPHIAFTWYVLIGSVVTFALGSLFSLPRPRRVPLAPVLLLLALASFASAQNRVPYLSAAEVGITAADPQLPDFSPVSTLINDAIAAHKLPGAVVLIGHNGQIVFEHAYGNRALEPAPGLQPEPMTDDTLFDMASLTKVLVTTTAILQLYEQHKLDLDAPVTQYIPDFGSPPLLSSFAAGGGPASPYKSLITIRQLLTHYSGLPEDVDLKDPWGLGAPDKAEGIRRALAATPYGPPGLTFKYSDINFITLGALVEKLSGQSLDDYASFHIFKSLGMEHSRYLPFAKVCDQSQKRGAAIIFDYDGPIANMCPPGTWSGAIIPNTAPTAHDDQGTPLTNPDFDHLLRGTVQDPTTRRMGGVAGHAGIFSTAEDASRFCDALLAKLLRNTGPFPLSQATLKLATSPNEPASAVNTATIFTPTGETTKGVASHGLGWDLNTAYSRPRGTIFPITTRDHQGSFGHTGFTGTSLWLDPTSDTYVILLLNAIHIPHAASISALRGAVATAAAHALGLNDSITPTLSSKPEPSKTLTGIDVLEQAHFAALKDLATRHGNHLRLGLLTNQSSLDASGHRTIDILAHASPELELKIIFAPEHGLLAHQDSDRLASETDPATHIPVIAVYGPKSSDKHPKQADLKQLDAVVIDLQDAGTRFWTFETLIGYFLEACSSANVQVVILDRPNPLGGLAVQGPTSDVGLENYNDFMPLPLRHGLTLGELGRYFNANATAVQLKPELLDARAVHIGEDTPESKPPATQPGLHAALTVIPMQNWTRSEFFADTGLTWTPPSPNLKSPAAAILYPGVGLTEQTNISVGRGTPTPFENLGAPWIKAQELAAFLTQRKIPGIEITPTTLTIAEDSNHYPSHGQTIPGIHFHVTDPAAFDSPELGIEILSALHHLYPSDFKLDPVRNLLVSADTLSGLKSGQDPRDIAASWSAALHRFEQARKPFLLYP